MLPNRKSTHSRFDIHIDNLHIPASPGREAILSALLEMKASEVSSRGRLQGKIVPGTIHVGTSFMLCTQMSTSLF